jgi:hypothetical protein
LKSDGRLRGRISANRWKNRRESLKLDGLPPPPRLEEPEIEFVAK